MEKFMSPKVTILAEISHKPAIQKPPNFLPWFHCIEYWEHLSPAVKCLHNACSNDSNEEC